MAFGWYIQNRLWYMANSVYLISPTKVLINNLSLYKHVNYPYPLDDDIILSVSNKSDRLIDFLSKSISQYSVPHDIYFQIEVSSTVGYVYSLGSSKLTGVNNTLAPTKLWEISKPNYQRLLEKVAKRQPFRLVSLKYLPSSLEVDLVDEPVSNSI